MTCEDQSEPVRPIASDLMKQITRHPGTGAKILEDLDFPGPAPEAACVQAFERVLGDPTQEHEKTAF